MPVLGRPRIVPERVSTYQEGFKQDIERLLERGLAHIDFRSLWVENATESRRVRGKDGLCSKKKRLQVVEEQTLKDGVWSTSRVELTAIAFCVEDLDNMVTINRYEYSPVDGSLRHFSFDIPYTQAIGPDLNRIVAEKLLPENEVDIPQKLSGIDIKLLLIEAGSIDFVEFSTLVQVASY